MDDKILAVWNMHLQKKQAMLPQSQLGGDSQQAFMRFRAVVEAYKIMAEEKQAKMMMGIPDAQSSIVPQPAPPDPSNFSSPPPPPTVGN
jgi:hypothetical protein